MELAALLHDIADWKFHGGDDTAGPRTAAEWLSQLGVEQGTIDHVCEIIATISFKGPESPRRCERWRDASCRTPIGWTRSAPWELPARLPTEAMRASRCTIPC